LHSEHFVVLALDDGELSQDIEITHESHGSDMKIFVARSYAYIGHILMKRAYLVRAEGNQFTTGHHQSTTGADHQLTTGPGHQVTACHQFALPSWMNTQTNFDHCQLGLKL
jgi:hypothetical protein